MSGTARSISKRRNGQAYHFIKNVPAHGDADNDARWLSYLETALKEGAINLDAQLAIAAIAGYELDYDSGQFTDSGVHKGPGPGRSARIKHGQDEEGVENGL